MMMMMVMMRPDVLFGEDYSAICQPIKLERSLSGMVDFTIAEVIYYVSCCLMTSS